MFLFMVYLLSSTITTAYDPSGFCEISPNLVVKDPSLKPAQLEHAIAKNMIAIIFFIVILFIHRMKMHFFAFFPLQILQACYNRLEVSR